jgi:hypothetical protein
VDYFVDKIAEATGMPRRRLATLHAAFRWPNLRQCATTWSGC